MHICLVPGPRPYSSSRPSVCQVPSRVLGPSLLSRILPVHFLIGLVTSNPEDQGVSRSEYRKPLSFVNLKLGIIVFYLKKSWGPKECPVPSIVLQLFFFFSPFEVAENWPPHLCFVRKSMKKKIFCVACRACLSAVFFPSYIKACKLKPNELCFLFSCQTSRHTVFLHWLWEMPANVFFRYKSIEWLMEP